MYKHVRVQRLDEKPEVYFTYRPTFFISSDGARADAATAYTSYSRQRAFRRDSTAH